MIKRKAKILGLMGVALSTCMFIGCSNKNVDNQEESPVEEVQVQESTETETEYVAGSNFSNETNPIVTFDIEGYGTIKAELYPDVAPNTVKNFIELANSGFYNGLTFHRVVNEFVIQGGDPTGDGTGGAEYNIKGEFTANGVDNKLTHDVGVLSMARAMDNDSASSQFFIVTGNAKFLDGQYAGFGQVIEGLDIIDKIDDVETDINEMPVEKVTINYVKVDTKDITYEPAEKIEE